ncbi:YihY/virulence factor BrkB family protein [Streptomyces poriferorum]|uniref:YihY/virulence factor BrkB family protein n=1 Tax=Streptomyces poriferorum TaxID=2798799 RepID=A0ABY9INE5_9ACTN|nr:MULTISPECIES: YihY/virulence factor BrkB family protein [unclassified Streptomyces]MDP5314217.1 YihY/virulence factor BrkB family protein [Streptomyces sp. Alt4]WLQ50481.1 YihY/virulence factor BrkB family protein [Streptomyces sp. Alt1]WLQ56855.1 YihY/virulence factor BrkB family protein [Streptomyces sp. Alt2]
MDWLKKLPVIGPLVSRLMETHAWRSYETLERVHWARLAAAITFISFLALFPLIAVAAAIGAALLSDKQLDKIEDKVADQVPGISDQLGIDNLVAHAGTVGLVAGALLLFTGIGWIGSMRDCLRAVWGMDDVDEGNPVLRKLKDAGVLFGLGGAALVTLAISSVGSVAVGRVADLLNIPEGGAGGVLLRVAALLVAVVADFLLLLYLLTLLPGVEPPRRRLMVAALIGAVGFELLKLLLGSYMRGVASKSMYGAFGVPIALLLWINFTAKLLLFCAAWTATRSKDEADPAADAEQDSASAAGDEAAGKEPGGSTLSGGGGGAPGPAAASAG